MKIYTKKGDRGDTSIDGINRISKNSNLIEAIGSVDELNSFIGLLNYKLKSSFLVNLQENLFVIGSILAESKSVGQFNETNTEKLEKKIDYMDKMLPPLKNFILPAGSISSIYANIARAICRRCERRIVALGDLDKYKNILEYMNRLSDYLFMLSRYINFKEGVEDIKIYPSQLQNC